MSRFDAASAADRRELVAEAIAAHRDRGSHFCTVEANTPPGGPVDPEEMNGDPAEADSSEAAADSNEAEADSNEAADDTSDAGAPEEPGTATDAPAWIQYSASESQLNLDCTDEEYDRIADVLASASAFTIDDQSSPEDTEGRNLRITVRTDADRVAQVVDRIFVEGFDYPDDFRLWATEI